MRKYTALSARSLACFLTDARDPESALCPHELVHPVESHATPSSDEPEHTSSRLKSTARSIANGHVAPKLANCKQPTTARRSGSHIGSLGSHAIPRPQIPTTDRSSLHHPSRQPDKDPTSFTQALFDALPVRLLEWIPRRSQRSPWHKHLPNSRRSSNDGPESPQTKVCQKQIVLDDGHKPIAVRRDDGADHEQAKATHPNELSTANGHAKEPVRLPQRRTSSIILPRNNGVHGSGLLPLLSSEVEVEEVQQEQCNVCQARDTIIGQDGNHQQPDTAESGVETCLSVPTLTCLSTDILTELKELQSESRKALSDAGSPDFFSQSLYYCLKDPCRLLASFEAPDSCSFESDSLTSSGQDSYSPQLNIQSLGLNLGGMADLCSWPEIFRNLSLAIHDLHVPASSPRPPHPDPPLSDRQAARVCVIGLYALSELVQTATSLRMLALPELFDRVRVRGRMHSFGDELADFELYHVLSPEALTLRRYRELQTSIEAQNSHLLELCDVFDDFVPLSLLENILGVVANRWAHWQISKTRKGTAIDKLSGTKPPNMMQLILGYMADDTKQRPTLMAELKASASRSGKSSTLPDSLRPCFLSKLTLYWLRTLMLRDWNGKPCIKKSDTVGVVLQTLASMYEKRCSIGLGPEEFWTPVFVQRLDPFDMPMEWLAFRPDNRTVHLLSYSFLFPPETVVNYFRAINYSRMNKSMEGAVLKKRAYGEFVVRAEVPVARRESLEQRLEISGQPRFVLEVRRDNVLTDAINQIWRRPKHELLRPLKVRMGMHEGEEGVDVGGVQQEMFRVLFGQALDPSYGMFTVDEETRMTWFQPESLEPLFKYEALGVLMSLAVYNSITLPITFPIAFYRRLLGLKVKKLDHVRDGWPQLAENLQGLLEWKEGDVADVHMRTYEFSYEAFGRIVGIDMLRHGRDAPWPPGRTKKGKEKAKTASFDVLSEETSDESRKLVPVTSRSRADDPNAVNGHQDNPEAPLVTNANREQYVKDYILWLTEKSIRPQYEAFARGFYTCLDRTALSIFTAESLQSFVEGIQEIDMDGLQASTFYEGYKADDQVVRWFWEIVKSWEPRRQKLLLEFVTASDRVPVNGVKAIGFGIQIEGPVDERLPSSHTCFGTLLLPQYSSKEALEKMLGIAVEQAKGFGTI